MCDLPPDLSGGEFGRLPASQDLLDDVGRQDGDMQAAADVASMHAFCLGEFLHRAKLAADEPFPSAMAEPA